MLIRNAESNRPLYVNRNVALYDFIEKILVSYELILFYDFNLVVFSRVDPLVRTSILIESDTLVL